MVAFSSSPVLATLVTGLSAAFGAGFLAAKARLSPIVGYLLAGILIGAHTPGFTGDVNVALELAEIGIVLLMFGVGLKFSLSDLMAVKKVALPGALGQIVVAMLLGSWLAEEWGWSIGSAMIFGLSLSVASTVVLLRALEERDEVYSFDGKVAIGWLIVEDLVIILALVMIPAIAHVFDGIEEPGERGLWASFGIGVGKIVLFFIFMELIGRRLLPGVLNAVAKTRSRELFTLSVFVVAVGVAFGAAHLFGVSFALGAFFAGMMIKESELASEVTEKALPFQDAFAVLFFVSVGMLFDPHVLVDHPLKVVAVVAVVVLAKFATAAAIVLAFRYPARMAFTIAASLSQIGEFSFVLGTIGMAYGVLTQEAYDLMLAASLGSITLNPFVFRLSDFLCKRLERYPKLQGWLEEGTSDLSSLPTEEKISLKSLTLLVGYGRVGKALQNKLHAVSAELVIIDQNQEVVEELRNAGVNAIAGDGMHEDTLKEAAIDKATAVVVAVPNPFEVREIVRVARELNPKAAVLVRARNEEELEYFEKNQIDLVVSGEKEVARRMFEYLRS